MRLDDYTTQFLRSVRFDAAPEDLEGAVLGGGTLAPAAGLDVYRKMYWYRLVDAHYALFPKTAQRMGNRRFTRVVCRCLAEQPSHVHVLEHLAMPFARFVAAMDLPVEERELAMLEAIALASLLAADPPLPLLTEADTQRPDFASLLVQPVPSLRVCRVSGKALRWFEDTPADGTARDEPIDDAYVPTDASADVVFVRPRFAVLHLRVDAIACETFARPRQPVGDLLGALAGPELDARVAFEHLSFAIRNSLLTCGTS